MIDLTFRNINRYFILSLENGKTDPARDYFDKNRVIQVEIKEFNALIGNKAFLINL